MDLTTDIQFVKGVGPKRASYLKQINILNILDLINYYPRKYLDRTNIKQIKDAKIGESIVIVARVESFGVKRLRKGQYFELKVSDETGYLSCIWFHGISWIMEKFVKGYHIAVFGKIEYYKGLRIIHPEFDILDDKSDIINTGKIIPIYASSSLLKQVSLDSKGFNKLILAALDNINHISDYFSDNFLKEQGLASLDLAIRMVHSPSSEDDITNSLYRLKFNEYFFQQLILAINKYKISQSKGKQFNELGSYAKSIYKNLNFQLTDAQIKVLREIRSDLSSKKPMNRLIQGDVGCGKTIVAIFASSIVVGDNCQVAIMAPTEILAEQHFKSFDEQCKNLGINCQLLVSNLSEKEKKIIYNELELGKIQIVIGTHALIQEKVIFNNLALVVFDEQHRFGVDQRKRLIDKGSDVNILSMTATPIPRTLTLTLHGDMDISWIDEQPKNRIPIKTIIVDGRKINRTYEFMKAEMDKGRFCFIVFPIIEESEKIDAKDAESAYKKYSNIIFKNYSVGFLHGKLKKDEKISLMESVNNGEIQCLISTTVVEVGINNQNATVMMIENAERFGLTQLHQLRGRVGRGEHQSYCILVQRKKGDIANKRLNILENTLDGFSISDEDLKLRGPGDFFGTQQHGYVVNKLCNYGLDGKIIRHARNLAFEIIDKDPNFTKHKKIKNKLMSDYKHMLEFVKIG